MPGSTQKLLHQQKSPNFSNSRKIHRIGNVWKCNKYVNILMYRNQNGLTHIRVPHLAIETKRKIRNSSNYLSASERLPTPVTSEPPTNAWIDWALSQKAFDSLAYKTVSELVFSNAPQPDKYVFAAYHNRYISLRATPLYARQRFRCSIPCWTMVFNIGSWHITMCRKASFGKVEHCIVYEASHYTHCSLSCMQRFEQLVRRYIQKAGATPNALSMHLLRYFVHAFVWMCCQCIWNEGTCKQMHLLDKTELEWHS